MIIKTIFLVGLALCLSFFQIKMIHSKNTSKVISYPYALADMDHGEEIGADKIGWVNVEHSSNMPPPLTLEDIIGQFPRHKIIKGQIIYNSSLIKNKLVIPKGKKAFAVKIASDDFCNLFIESGMHVDICIQSKEGYEIIESIQVIDVEKSDESLSLVSVLFLGTTEQAIKVCEFEMHGLEVMMRSETFAEPLNK